MTQADLDCRLGASSIVSSSLAAKLRYLLELRCRELEVTCSKFIAAAVDASMKDDKDGSNYANETLWDADPAVRLYRLATTRADLLSHRERLLWRSILKDERVYTDNALDPEKISQQWQRLIIGF